MINRNWFSNFWKGVASIFDIYPSTPVRRLSQQKPEEADYEAIKSDWEAVGQDMRNAMGDFDHELNKN
jgi:hypothetical protein